MSAIQTLPLTLYDHPANKFVAGFIGSPQMNFLDGIVTEKNGKVAVRVGDTDIAIDPAKGKVLKDGGYMGKEVTIGVRPEDLYDTPEHLELYKDSKAKETARWLCVSAIQTLPLTRPRARS